MHSLSFIKSVQYNAVYYNSLSKAHALWSSGCVWLTWSKICTLNYMLLSQTSAFNLVCPWRAFSFAASSKSREHKARWKNTSSPKGTSNHHHHHHHHHRHHYIMVTGKGCIVQDHIILLLCRMLETPLNVMQSISVPLNITETEKVNLYQKLVQKIILDCIRLYRCT